MTFSASTLLRNIALAIVALSTTTSFANAVDNTVKVTRKSWPEITLGKKVMVAFSYPWCEHCRNFKKKWRKVKDNYKDDDSIVFLEVDCEDKEGDMVCTDFDINGVPEVYYGDSAIQQEYKGTMDEKNIIDFIETNMTKPLCSVLHTESCPQENVAEMTAIDKLTTEYLEKITSLKVSNPSEVARQAVLKNGIKNIFWYDVSGIDQYPTKDEDTDFSYAVDEL